MQDLIEIEQPKVHAWLAPSGGDEWMTCLGAKLKTKGMRSRDSEYSIEGTDYHELAAVCLDDENQLLNAQDFVGHPMKSGKNIVSEENATYLQNGYINPVRELLAQGGTLIVEKALPLFWYTRLKEDEGTVDMAILRTDRELIIGDLKFGRGVAVSPVSNRQCRIYAISLIEAQQLWEEYDTVRIIIFQPRAGDGKPQEWVTTMAALKEFKQEVKAAASMIIEADKAGRMLPLVPSEKACRWCLANGDCEALTKFKDQAMADGFEPLPEDSMDAVMYNDSTTLAERLGRAADSIGLVEIWMKGTQARVELELLAGNPVIGADGPYKLVQGKKGNRKWDDEEAVTKLFKSYRLKKEQMYNSFLISPTDAEKLLEKTNPTRWKDVKELYSQAEGKLHVANAKDTREAITMGKSEEGFDPLEVELADLL